MPIYDYQCAECDEQFELFLRKADDPAVCPECGSEDLDKLFSTTAVHGETSHDKAMRAAGKRDAAQAKDRFYERKRYEDSHDRHGH